GGGVPGAGRPRRVPASRTLGAWFILLWTVVVMGTIIAKNRIYASMRCLAPTRHRDKTWRLAPVGCRGWGTGCQTLSQTA
ncbi:MAG: hypothetical protein LBH75_00665, partial [Treponema sp.]|nr:hypothetical protein [Treponema sp.]